MLPNGLLGRLLFFTAAVSFMPHALRGEHLSVVAEYMQPAPGTTGNFRVFGKLDGYSPSIEGNDVAFGATTDEGAGIFAFVNGELHVVADTSMIAPGTGSTFGFGLSSGSSPDISGGRVVFISVVSGHGQQIWLWEVGAITRIVDTNTMIPGREETFRGFGIGDGASPRISGQNIVFSAWDQELNGGIYAYVNGKLRTIADTTTVLPGANTSPATFGLSDGISPDISGENVVFFARWSFDGNGIFLFKNNEIHPVALNATPLPAGSHPFCGATFGNLAFSGLSPAISGDNVAFGTTCGVYLYSENVVSLVADMGTVSPSGTGGLFFFGGGAGSSPRIDGEYVAFTANGTNIREGVFASVDGCVRLIAGEFTGIPGFNNSFASFGLQAGVGPSISGRNVAFMGFPAPGIYVGNVNALPITLSDMTFMQRCFSGSNVPVPEGCCQRFDGDLDGDVDLDDHAEFITTITGPE